jgi:hypothetical protein
MLWLGVNFWYEEVYTYCAGREAAGAALLLLLLLFLPLLLLGVGVMVVAVVVVVGAAAVLLLLLLISSVKVLFRRRGRKLKDGEGGERSAACVSTTIRHDREAQAKSQKGV